MRLRDGQIPERQMGLGIQCYAMVYSVFLLEFAITTLRNSYCDLDSFFTTLSKSDSIGCVLLKISYS